MNDCIVFTNYNITVKYTDAFQETFPTNKFLEILEKKLNDNKYSIFYSENKRIFYITYDGRDYDVVLPAIDQKSLESNNFTPLVNNLLYLAAKKRNIIYSNNKEAVRETKIKAMENSNYEDIEDVEDLRLYLDYLKNTALKKATKQEDIETIQTKIISISLLIKRKTRDDDNRIQSPLDLKSYMEKFVYEVMDKVNKLDNKDKKMILSKTSKILKEYKKYINYSFGNKRIFNNKYLPVNILDMINEVEGFLDHKLGAFINPLHSELSQIMNELEELTNENREVK